MRLNTTALSAATLIASTANAAINSIPNNNRNQRITALAENGDLLAISMRSGETTNATYFKSTDTNQWQAEETLALRTPSNATGATFMGDKAIITSIAQPNNEANPQQWISTNFLNDIDNTIGLQLDRGCDPDIESLCINRINENSLRGTEFGTVLTFEKDSFFWTEKGIVLIKPDNLIHPRTTNEDYQYAIVADGHILLDQTSGRRRLVVAEIPSGNDSLQVPEGTNAYPQGKLTCSTSFLCIDSLEYDNESNASEFKIYRSIKANDRTEFSDDGSYALENYSINDQGFLKDDTYGTYIWFYVTDETRSQNRLVFAPYSLENEKNKVIDVNNAKYLTITEQPTKVFVQNFQHLGIETTSMAYTPLGPINPNDLTADSNIRLTSGSLEPTQTPTLSLVPTNAPSPQPTPTPTFNPTHTPTPAPTDAPSANPASTAVPTLSGQPSVNPTGSPDPTHAPTEHPSLRPTHSPSSAPTSVTQLPTQKPTLPPTQHPTLRATENPTAKPTAIPNLSPKPTQSPTALPTLNPTSLRPTLAPSTQPNVDSTGSSDDAANIGAIVGGVFGSVALVALLSCLYKWQKGLHNNSDEQQPSRASAAQGGDEKQPSQVSGKIRFENDIFYDPGQQ